VTGDRRPLSNGFDRIVANPRYMQSYSKFGEVQVSHVLGGHIGAIHEMMGDSCTGRQHWSLRAARRTFYYVSELTKLGSKQLSIHHGGDTEENFDVYR
jgi:hypothetical protein